MLRNEYIHTNLHELILCMSRLEHILILQYQEAFDICMNTGIKKYVLLLLNQYTMKEIIQSEKIAMGRVWSLALL
jgi:hypothetical protein